MQHAKIFSALVPVAESIDRDVIAEALEKFGAPVLAYTAKAGITIRPMTAGEQYRDASPAIKRMRINVDELPAPPAGLFVVEERTVYLRSRSAMTIAHEFGHAIDCALGGGVYRSGIDPLVRKAYAQDRDFVTPYASTSLDEYFAECVRAYVEANDAMSVWPAVTQAKLRKCSPGMHAYLTEVFDVEIGS